MVDFEDLMGQVVDLKASIRADADLTKTEIIHIAQDIFPRIDNAVMFLDGLSVIGNDPPVDRVGEVYLEGLGEELVAVVLQS